MQEQQQNGTATSGETPSTIIIDCDYDEPHTHEFPGDWVFGGADGLHPGADPRWEPTVYQYYDEHFDVIHTSSAPLCDQQAVDEFTHVANYGRDFNPVYVSAKRMDERVGTMLPFKYNKRTDTFTEIVRDAT